MQGTFQLIRSDMNFILSKRISLFFPGIILLSARFTCQDYSKWRVIPHSCWILSRWKIKISRSFVVLRTRTKLIMLRLMPSDVTLRRNLNRINRYFEQTMSTLIEKGHLVDWSASIDGLLFATDVSTTCAETMVRVKWLQSPRSSFSIKVCYSLVQTIFL